MIKPKTGLCFLLDNDDTVTDIYDFSTKRPCGSRITNEGNR